MTGPNGGETWQTGEPAEITWSSAGIANVKIELSYFKDGITQNHIIANSLPNGDGIYIWNAVPANVAGNFCRVKISDADNPGISDISDASFTIVAPDQPEPDVPTIQVIGPNGGESLQAGGNYQIYWQASSSIQTVDIWLYQLNTDGTDRQWIQIADSIAADFGSYLWTDIPANAVWAYSRIRVQTPPGVAPRVYDDSDRNFAVVALPPPEAPTVQVLSPNGGETLQAGGPYEINWTAGNSIGQVKIELSIDAGETYTDIVFNEANDGAYIWPVDAQQTESDFCRIRVSDATDSSVFDVSNLSFSIVAPAEPPAAATTIRMISPNGAETWQSGQARNVTWEASTSIQEVNIELTYFAQNEVKTHTIVAETPNDGIFKWQPIPLDAIGKFCRIRISDADPNSSISDESDASFTINEGPMIQITSPNGGEIWERGTDREITWNASSSIQTVHIYLDNGTTQTSVTINAIPADTGSYLWTDIPANAIGSSNRILIETPPGVVPRIADISDQNFTIQEECTTLGCVLNRILASSSDDSDNDSIPDDVEAMLGSDPNDHDSDHDGVFDYTELFHDWNLDDYAPIPDLDSDGTYAINDPYDVEQARMDGELVDTDEDGIADCLEYYGYVYNWMAATYLPWNGDIGYWYYKTDPMRSSTDQDPYPDGMEVSEVDMDVTVAHPGSLPMVPAYPNIVVKLEGYQVTLNEDIVITEGKSLSKGTSWSTQTEETFSHYDQINYGGSVTVEAGFSGWSFEGSV